MHTLTRCQCVKEGTSVYGLCTSSLKWSVKQNCLLNSIPQLNVIFQSTVVLFNHLPKHLKLEPVRKVSREKQLYISLGKKLK